MKSRPRSSILGEEHYRFVDELMAENTDLTSRQLYAAFKEAYPSMAVSVSTMKRARRHLGWTSKRTRYCQLISDENKEKRIDWCLHQVLSGDLEFKDAICRVLAMSSKRGRGGVCFGRSCQPHQSI